MIIVETFFKHVVEVSARDQNEADISERGPNAMCAYVQFRWQTFQVTPTSDSQYGKPTHTYYILSQLLQATQQEHWKW